MQTYDFLNLAIHGIKWFMAIERSSLPRIGVEIRIPRYGRYHKVHFVVQ
jgi:hypothetical protein